VLVVDQASNRFVAYDRQGQIVRDYRARLDLGSGFTARNVWVDGRLLSWDGPTASHGGNLVGAPRGLAEPLGPSRILIHAQASATGPNKVRVLAPDGEITNEHTITGSWEAFDLSPARGYLYASRHVDAGDTTVGAVIRITDGTIVWQRDVKSAGFARDDSRFIYSPTDFGSPVRVLNPATGAEVAPTPGQPPWATPPNIPYAYVQGTLSNRAMLMVSGNSADGNLLYSIDWQGIVRRFGSEVPRYSNEYLHAVDPGGNKVLWSRDTNGLDGNPATHVGAFELDFASMMEGPWTGTDYSCFGRPAEVFFTLVGSSLQSCACESGTCTPIATLPALPEVGWLPRVVTNVAKTVAVVTYDWPLNRQPTQYPNLRCFAPNGQLLATVPFGSPEIDETGQLVLLHPSLGTGWEHAIVDLSRGSVSMIGMPPGWSPRIIYE